MVKSIFIQGMSNPQIQMDLLSEDRPSRNITLRNHKRKRTRKSTTDKQHSRTKSKCIRDQTKTKTTQRRSILPIPPNNNKIPDCWKCGYKLIKGHLDNCPAKNSICNICKKVGHYNEVCRSEMPPRRSEIQNTQGNNQIYNDKSQQQTIHNNKQTQDQFVIFNQFLIMSQSKRRKKKRQKQSTPRAHAISGK